MAARGGAEAWLGVPVVKCECRRSRSPVEIRGRRWRLFGRMSHGSLERLALAGAGVRSIASVDAPLRLQAGSFNGDELLPGDLRKANR